MNWIDWIKVILSSLVSLFTFAIERTWWLSFMSVVEVLLMSGCAAGGLINSSTVLVNVNK
jgi:hypothetical protein